MARVSPFALPAKERSEWGWICQDPSIPNSEIHFQFKAPTPVEYLSIRDKADEYIAKYITGIGPIGKDGFINKESPLYQEPEPLPAVRGEAVIITPSTAEVGAFIELCQIQDDPLDFKEIVGWLAASETIAAQIVQAYTLLKGGLTPDAPKLKAEESSESA